MVTDLSGETEGKRVNVTNPLSVRFSNGSGFIKSVLQEENRLGSECSGIDGATGRVLTLQNSSESGAPTSVWVEDQLINPSDVTYVHNSSSSTLTFDNINIFDADTLRIRYYV